MRPFTQALQFAMGSLLVVLLGCEAVADSARLGVDLERRYPGSKIAVQDLRARSARRIEVTIRHASFGDLDLSHEARGVARTVQRRLNLRADRDTVAVTFEAERRMGILTTSRSGQFVYAVAELAETQDD